jgi:hypothetical protein
MATDAAPDSRPQGIDLGDYCRQVEAHLARVNEGQLIRIAGTAFELVRRWALTGIPLSVVFHGIAAKAERHRASASRRPLRLEFCEVDVRVAFDTWRRAVGATATLDDPAAPDSDADAPGRRKPSVGRHIDRALEKLVRVAGRLDLSDSLRAAAHATAEELGALREQTRVKRLDRAALEARLSDLDEQLVAAVRAAMPAGELERLRQDSALDLHAYRGRLAPDVWERSVRLGVDRLLRDRLGLPSLRLGV